MSELTFTVRWHLMREESAKMDACRSLYAYLHPETDRILYIGKADRCSVGERLYCPGKIDRVWKRLDEQGIERCKVIVGDVYADVGRFTREMLADIESLLIYRIRPIGNKQSKATRISRPTMEVRCEGNWPHRKLRFVDT
jgi:hypothetical protein